MLGDVGSGHDIRGTIFVHSGVGHRSDGPPERRTLGETESITDLAWKASRGAQGAIRVCTSIIGLVDLTLGDQVTPLLEEHVALAGGRFRGARNWESERPDGRKPA